MTRTEDLETVYTSPDEPDPKDTRLVLAFILAPTETFCGDDEERELLQAARHEAAENWKTLRANHHRDDNEN